MADLTRKQVEEAIDGVRCHVTGNPCGTDTRMVGAPPCCSPCVLASAARALLGPTLLFRCSKCTCFISRRRGRSGGPCPYDHDTGGPTTECGGTLIPLVAGLEEE